MEEILKNITELSDNALDGNINELQAYIDLKKIKDLATQCQKEIKDAAWNETLKHDGKTFEFNGFKVTKSQKTTWSYKHLEDWTKIKKELSDIETNAKMAYTMNNKILVSEDTGEVQESAHKSVTDVIKIEIIKNK